MNQAKKYLAVFCLTIIACLFTTMVKAKTPVELHGKLRVEGNQIVGEHGKPVQLMGMSHFWSVWGGQNFYNKEVVDWLVKDWKVDVVRAAIAVDINQEGEGNLGWIYNKEGQFELAETLIRAAIDNGVYVIVDFHTHNTHTEHAKEFFEYLAKKYGRYPNLIWEPFNEPIRQSWEEISEFMNAVTSVIRPHSDNLIVAGTRQWSQLVNEAADNPLPDKNTAYTLHFYAGTHGQELRDIADYALSKGIALFITEWGTSHADGGSDQIVHKESTKEWVEWALERNLSMANWSVFDKAEASAALNPGAPITGGWCPEKHLSVSGQFIRDMIRETNKAKYKKCR